MRIAYQVVNALFELIESSRLSGRNLCMTEDGKPEVIISTPELDVPRIAVVFEEGELGEQAWEEWQRIKPADS